MIDKLKINTKLIVVKTQRSEKGLALSSRNVRLTDAGRETALTIYRTQLAIKNRIYDKTIKELEAYGFDRLRRRGFEVEYVAIVSGHTLKPIKNVDKEDYIVVTVAAWLEGVRLIDNMIIKDHRAVKNIVR